MADYLQRGGPLMWLIILASIVAVGVFFERFLYLHRATIHVGDLLQGLANLIRRRRFSEALSECAGTPGPVARVIHSAIIRHDAPRSELREVVQEAGQLEVPKLERYLAILSTIAFVTPLLGLLGTVTGMIEAFVSMSAHGGYATATDLASGIYKSLLTTAAGLGVAIPAHVACSYLSARVNSLMHDMERGGIEIVNLLTEKREDAAIISFPPAGRTVAGD